MDYQDTKDGAVRIRPREYYESPRLCIVTLVPADNTLATYCREDYTSNPDGLTCSLPDVGCQDDDPLT